MNELIKVNYKFQERDGNKWIDKEVYPESEITLETFKRSFVDERWVGERRYNKTYTKLGYYHTKTICKLDENRRSILVFTFPE